MEGGTPPRTVKIAVAGGPSPTSDVTTLVTMLCGPVPTALTITPHAQYVFEDTEPFTRVMTFEPGVAVIWLTPCPTQVNASPATTNPWGNGTVRLMECRNLPRFALLILMINND